MTVVPFSHPPAHVEKIMEKDGGLVRYLTATEQGKPCWFFIRLNPASYREYTRHLRHQSMNIRDFGVILLGGWGKTAPAYAVRLMQKKYGLSTDDWDMPAG